MNQIESLLKLMPTEKNKFKTVAETFSSDAHFS